MKRLLPILALTLFGCSVQGTLHVTSKPEAAVTSTQVSYMVAQDREDNAGISRNMLPTRSQKQRTDSASLYAKTVSDFGVRQTVDVQLPNNGNIAFSKFRKGARASNLVSSRLGVPSVSVSRRPTARMLPTPVIISGSEPSLNLGVNNIIFASSEEEVIGIAARGIVAPMTDEHSFGNWSVMDFPGYAMCGSQSVRFAPSPDNTIAERMGASGPLPTPVALNNLRPEPVSQRLNPAAPFSAFGGTEEADAIRPAGNRSSALLALVFCVQGQTSRHYRARLKTTPSLSNSIPQNAVDVPDTGRERWSIKLLRDPDAKKVNFTPKPSTVEELSALTPPFTKPPKTGDQTRYPSELQTYSVTGQVVGLKLEADKDIHFVIAGTTGATMIIEFPDPAQSAKGIKGPEAAKARADCVKLFGKPGKWRSISGRSVTVTGPLFFDVKHAVPQTGVAVNGAEIHEVLSIAEVKQ